MLFVELRFFIFFLGLFVAYWSLSGNRSRKLLLLAGSYFFYAAWDWRFLSLILISTLVDYVAGIKLERNEEPVRRRSWLLLSLTANLSMLGLFKYFNFFVESAIDLGNLLGLSLSHSTLHIVLPVGISFYTFQTMSYSIDVHARKMKATRNLLDLSLFVAFFPQLVAGPIVRAREFLPQLGSPRRFDTVQVRPLLVLFLVGFFKKACISDNLAPIVDRHFADTGSWIAILFYAVQIYCDFSGYSDMAIACAGLLGYKLRDNFAAPYLAASITDFWRRWHMSLSSWLRDYLYIPLGGNRGSKLFTYRNLMLTMLLGGLWHGASWNFVIWGGLHGLALIAHKEWTTHVRAGTLPRRISAVVGPVLTFYWVCITWIFFRAPDLGSAVGILRTFVLLESPGPGGLGAQALATLAILLALHWAAHRKMAAVSLPRVPPLAFATAYGACFAVAVSLVPTGHRPFIYFQF